jgi:Ran GTPase-activating protein (RanGAP) involved in mRNA processing and transport
MMVTDTMLKNEGMRVLAENLGLVEAERFITLILREPFDYTEWQRDLFKDMPLNEFLEKAMENRERKLGVKNAVREAAAI